MASPTWPQNVILLLFLRLAFCLFLVFLVRILVVLPVVLPMCLMTEGWLVVLSLIGAGWGDVVRGCKALHTQRGARASTTHVLHAACAAVHTGPPLGAAYGDVGVGGRHIAKVAAAHEGSLPLQHAVRATAPL